MSKLEILFLVVTLACVSVVLEAVRRRKLLESFALLWIGVGVSLVSLALARPLVDRVAKAVGVSYGASLILGLGVLFLLFVALTLSIHVSRLEDRVEVLAQEVAFLRGVQSPVTSADRE